MYRIFLFIFISGIFSCCTGNGHQNIDNAQPGKKSLEYPVDIEIDIKKALPLSENLRSVSTIEFSEEPAEIMGQPQSIVVRGDTIYGIDSHINPGFYAYLKNGEQILNYCSRGNGPEDVVSPFCLNVTDEGMNAFDLGSTSLIFIDKKGSFLRKVTLSPMALAAAVDNSGGIWTDYSNQRYSDTRLTYKADSLSEEKIVLKVPEKIKGMTTIGIQNLTNLEDGTINYVPEFEPVIYQLKEGEATPKYNIDYKGLWPDDETFKSKYTGDSWAVDIREFPVTGITVKENENWLVIGFENGEDRYINVYDKIHGHGRTLGDEEKIYYNPKYIVDDNLYMLRRDDKMDVLDLSDIRKK